ncbi:MAG: hypothetical protein ACTHZ1_01880 [Sphingobacterium sp.]
MIQQVIKKLESLKRLDQTVEKYTQITDEEFSVHGVLVFIPLDKFEVKVLIPTPHHKKLFDENIPTFRQVLAHPEVMLLR